MTPYPDPRYPELRCEDPTAPGCATWEDHLRWLSRDIHGALVANINIIAIAVIATLIVFGIALLIRVQELKRLDLQFTEDDIDNRPFGEIFPFMRRTDDDE